MIPDERRGDGGQRRLATLAVSELFHELRLANAAAVPAAAEGLRRLRIDQIELELQTREMQETVADLDLALTTFAEHFYHAPAAYLVLDANGRIGRASGLAVRLLGCASEAQLQRQPLAGWLTPESLPRWRRGLSRAAARSRGPAVLIDVVMRQRGLRLRAAVSLDVDAYGRHRGFRALLSVRSVNSRSLCVTMLRRMDTLAGRRDGASSHRRALLQLLVPTLGDLVWWDQVCRGGSLRRIATAGIAELSLGAVQAALQPSALIEGGQNLHQQVRASRQPLLMGDCGRARRSHGRASIGTSVRSVIVVPVIARGQVASLLTVVRQRSAPRLNSIDLAVAEHVAQRIVELVSGGEECVRLRPQRRRRRRRSPPAKDGTQAVDHLRTSQGSAP